MTQQRTTFSYIQPLEVSESKEAAVSISVKEVRYGGKSLPKAEVVAVINGIKRNWPVPMDEPFRQEFGSVLDEMVFKFAVTSNNDLLGFLYLEIPKKFRSMKNMKMDDWFPIKRLETEDKEKEMYQNYQAKIVIEYEASRKLEVAKPMTNRAPKAELYQEIASSLKEKLDKLYKRIDEYEAEGFRYLDEYRLKLGKGRAVGATGSQEVRKGGVKVAPSPNKTIGAQKEAFYRTRAPNEVEASAGLYASAPVDKTLTKATRKVDAELPADDTDDCPNCEKLYKELSYSNQELVQANSRMAALERAKMTPENQRLKAEVEALQQHLSKERRDLNIRLKEQNTNLQAETVKLSNKYEEENEAAKSLQNEARELQQQLADRLKRVEQRERELAKKRDGMSKKEGQLIHRQQAIKSELEHVKKEQSQLESERKDMNELKERMMIERQRVFEEQSRLAHSSESTQDRSSTIQTIEDFLEEEREQFQKELSKKNTELEQLKAETEKQRRLYELEVRTLAENKVDYERRLREHNEALAAHKIEVARLAREKNNLANNMVEFLEQKKANEHEKEMANEEIERNYDLLDEQTQVLAEQKAEYNNLLARLKEFEESINAQSKQHAEQKAKFQAMQRSFFNKVSQPGYDFKELKKLAEEVGVSLNDADERFKEAQRLDKDMTRARMESRQSFDRASNRGSSGDIRVNRKSEQRVERRLKDTMSFIGGGQTESRMKLQQNASQIVEKVFSDASLAVYKKHAVNKQEIVDGLRFKIESLQEEIRALTEKSQGAKINFLSEHTEEDLVKASLNSQKQAEEEEERPKTFTHPEEIREAEEERSPEEFLETMKDLCEATLHQLEQDEKVGLSVVAAKEKVAFLQSASRVLEEQFKVFRQLSSLQGQDEVLAAPGTFNWEKDQLDYERIRAKFEVKMKALLDYIQSLKINNDFFNPGIDGAILSA